MMKRTVVWLLLCVLQCIALLAQAGGAPKPTAEHKRLGYFVGKWSYDGVMNPSPMGPGGKIKMNDSCEWFAGGFTIVCNSSGTTPMGPMKGLGLISFLPEEKKYVYFGVDSIGMASTSKGTLQGNTWNFAGEDKMGGKLVKSRITITEHSPTSYTFKFEMNDGTKWMTVMEGKETKIGK